MVLTSGKVPLEKTLQAGSLVVEEQGRAMQALGSHRSGVVHEQTGLSTGAVTDNNELSSDFRHCF